MIVEVAPNQTLHLPGAFGARQVSAKAFGGP